MFSSALISGFYDDTLLSLGIILCALCFITALLRIFLHQNFETI
jgi:hypothetical protein